MRQGDFPTRANCDPNNPEEAFLWMFAALPMVKGAPLIMPVEYWRHVSKRLWDLGARPVEEPLLEWVAPSATDPNWLTSPGRWVAAGTAPKLSDEEQAAAAISRMAQQQKAELYNCLCRWEAGEDMPDSPSGRVAGTLTDHQKGVVLKVLRNAGSYPA